MNIIKSFLYRYIPIKLVIIVGCFLLTSVLLYASSTAESKATWLWDASMITKDAEEVLAFSREKKVNLIYLQISEKVETEDYRRFIRQAYEAGIQVHALDGRPEWGRRTHMEEGLSFIHWVQDYNEHADRKERFTGIHLDVEPYQLNRWKTDQDELVEEWANNMTVWLNHAKTAGLYVAADVPFWINKVPVNRYNTTLGSWMLERFDSLTIMAYRDQSSHIYEAAQALLEEGERMKKPVYIGVEMVQSDEGDHVSFHSKSNDYIYSELSDLKKQSKGHYSYAGVAMHHLEEWMKRYGQQSSSITSFK